MYIYDDGGRKAAGYKGDAGDCGARALAIAHPMDYKEAYKLLAQANKDFGFSKSARNGIMKEVYESVLNTLGYEWCKAPKFEGRKARPRDLEGTVIARQAGHYVAVFEGGVFDTWDSSRRMVYGYWKKV